MFRMNQAATSICRKEFFAYTCYSQMIFAWQLSVKVRFVTNFYIISNAAHMEIVILSDCPSVKRVLCDKTKEYAAAVSIQHERAITLVFQYQTEVGG